MLYDLGGIVAKLVHFFNDWHRNHRGALARQNHHQIGVIPCKICGIARFLVEPLIQPRAFAGVHQAAPDPMNNAPGPRALQRHLRINPLARVPHDVE